MKSVLRPGEPTDYDVVVVGGAVAGAGTALLLRRQLADARILVIERCDAFPHKVGEATVEVSGFFLQQVLGLSEHLAEQHLPKHGLRYWFSDGGNPSLDQMSEIGPRSEPQLPSFQLDRSRLDEHLLQLAASEGVEVARPARARSFDPGWPISRLVLVDDAGVERHITTRWLVDASGRHAFVARRLKLLKRTERHPISASWARWQGVADLDAPTEKTGLPAIDASRVLATNHFCGDGWWCWVIPLACGKTSIGWVYNRDLVGPDPVGHSQEGNAKDRYLAFVRSQPGLRQLVADAEPCADDIHSYRHLSYRSTRYADRGWALVGDAGSFLDPYYSPGLDHAALSISATASLIGRDLSGELEGDQLKLAVEQHDAGFVRSYERWLDALYTGKYRLLGDAELTTCAFLVDTSLYYLGVVTPAYRDVDTLRNPMFGVDVPQAKFAFWALRTFNRRLQRLAGLRRKRGRFGRKNVGWRLQFEPFRLGAGAVPALARGLGLMAKMELQQLVWNLMPAPKGSSHMDAKPGEAINPGGAG